jgi:diguanylate cyclase (GGDEF)-like protein/PAS domain S-box-containing protein
MSTPRWRYLIGIGVAGLLCAILLVVDACVARAQTGLQPMEISSELDRLEIGAFGVVYEPRGDSLQVETARAADGTAGRMAIRAVTPGTAPRWFVFALANSTDKPQERWLVAERYQHAGSGIVWPDLDARRLENVTPSLGFIPERLPFDGADAFRLTLEPGQTVTFAVELSTQRVPRMQLWKSLEYEKRSRNRQLFHGILLGITGLLAVFLTVVFAANHKAIFPAAALFTWAVLAYLCVDFGFWHKLFNIRPEENAIYRAAGEALMALSLLVFTQTFLRLGRWHALVRSFMALLTIALLALFALAFLDPRLAATFARLAMGAVLIVAILFTAWLAVLGQDRALAVVPTWILFAVWMFGASFVLSGRLQSDVVVNGLTAGLVLLVVLIGFTVTQFAFRSVDPILGGLPSDQHLRALAVDGTGAAVFEWSARRDDIKTGPSIDAALGLEPAERQEPVVKFLERVHPSDRDRLQVQFGTLRERAQGSIEATFRMRHRDGDYRWFDIEASILPTSDRAALRAVGLMRETTELRQAQERLLHDAVHDSRTGLPNRALFLDRLTLALARARSEPLIRPLVVVIDIDRLEGGNEQAVLQVSDSLPMMLAHRLKMLVGPTDALARVGSDQFALAFVHARDERDQRLLLDSIRAAIKGPIAIGGQEIILTGSIGVTEHTGTVPVTAADMLAAAQTATLMARRGGRDRVERFQPDPAVFEARRLADAELEAAIERRQIKVMFQPVMFLHTDRLAGFEVVVRWDHPRLGQIDPTTVAMAETLSEAVVAKLGAFVVQTAAAEAVRWQKEFERPDAPLFVAVDISQAQLKGSDLAQIVRHLSNRGGLAKGSLRLEVSESLLLDNPQQGIDLVQKLAASGARLTLDDFGAGYSSLAFLGSFPVDAIKIDAGLVSAAERNAQGTAVVRAVVALTHELGKTVVADGVSTDATLGLLRTIGCELAQGDLFGPAVSARDAIQMVKAERRTARRSRTARLFQLRPRGERAEAPAATAKPANISAPASAVPAAAPKAVAAVAAPAVSPPVQPQPAAARGPMAAPQPMPMTASQSTPIAAPLPTPVTAPTRLTPLPAAEMPAAAATARPILVDIRAAATAAVDEADRALARLRAEMARPTPVVPAPITPQPVAPQSPPPQPPGPTAPPPTSYLAQALRTLGAAAPAPQPPAPPPPQPAPAPPVTKPMPDLSALPPAVAASLAKLAGAKSGQ